MEKIIINQETDALGVIDMQGDFNGDDDRATLGVRGASTILQVVNFLIELFRLVFASKDNHPADHGSFANQHGVEPFTVIRLKNIIQTAWPVHAVGGTWGAEFIAGLITNKFFAIIFKGMNKLVDSYSSFFENDRVTPTGLSGMLRERGIKRIFFCGLAKWHCVAYSCLDAVREGFEVYMIEDATAAIPDDLAGPDEQEITARQRLIDAGVKFCNSTDLVAA